MCNKHKTKGEVKLVVTRRKLCYHFQPHNQVFHQVSKLQNDIDLRSKKSCFREQTFSKTLILPYLKLNDNNNSTQHRLDDYKLCSRKEDGRHISNNNVLGANSPEPTDIASAEYVECYYTNLTSSGAHVCRKLVILLLQVKITCA